MLFPAGRDAPLGKTLDAVTTTGSEACTVMLTGVVAWEEAGAGLTRSRMGGERRKTRKHGDACRRHLRTLALAARPPPPHS